MSAEPEAVDFGRVYVGIPAQGSVRLRSTSAAVRQVRLEADAPFSVAPSVELEPGGARSVQVTALASAPGELSGALRVLAEEGELTIALHAEASAPPVCGAAPTCQRARFDPGAGSCVSEPLDDGSPCAGPCLVAGRCVAGGCVGALDSCDDGDPCTADACDGAGGCLHVPVSCAAPADPCQVASCDPARGCITGPAADGTTCGPGDCATSQVCMGGACVSRPTPEGAACGETSACHVAGRCQSGACQQAPAQSLEPAWTYTSYYAPTLAGLLGVVDEDGNLYLLGTQLDMWLASLTREGTVRFQARISPGNWASGSSVVVQHGVIALQTQEGYGAWSTRDGSPVWMVNLDSVTVAAGLGTTSAAQGPYQVLPVLDDGRLTLAIDISLSPSQRQRVIAQFDWQTGTPLWTRPVRHAPNGLLAFAGDGQGNLFFVEGQPQFATGPDALVSVDRSGHPRWRVELPPDWSTSSLAVVGELVALGGNQAVSNTSSVQYGLHYFRAADGAPPTNPGFDGQVYMPWAGDSPGCRGDGHLGVAFNLDGAAWPEVTFSPSDGTQLSGSSSASSGLGLSLMSARGSLVSLADPDSSFRETPTQAQGAASQCSLGGNMAPRSNRQAYTDFVLDRGRLFVFTQELYWTTASVYAYDVPGLELAAHGWVASRGNLQRTGTPR